MGELIAILVVVLIVLAAGISWTIKHLLYICSPNEVLVFSGSSRMVGDRRVGYKIIKGGRAIRKPLFEVVDRMDLTNMPIDLEVQAAYSKGGIPLNVVGIANVKVAGHQPVLDNSIERFLGKSRQEIMLIAKETLEGTLRGVLATLTPEEVNEDKIKFSEALLEEATDDLNRLGLALDTLKIQDVSDDVSYLDSIGRKRSAEIQRKARVAEAEAHSLARVREAENHRQTEMKRIEADTATVKAENARRIVDATTKGGAMVAESRGQVAAELAKANAELDVQRARIERERGRLTADVLEPARAAKAAQVNQAKADAAIVIEQGRAQAEAMSQLTATWKSAGTQGRDVFLMQKLDAVMHEILQTMGQLHIDKVTVLGMGGGAGGGGSTGGGDLPGLAQRLICSNEEIKAALGVDFAGALMTKLEGGKPSADDAPDRGESEAARPRIQNPDVRDAPAQYTVVPQPARPAEAEVETRKPAQPEQGSRPKRRRKRRSSGGSQSQYR